MTKTGNILGLIGRAVDYSYSPLIHNTACRLLDLPYDYKIFNIADADQLETLLINAENQGIAGFNVTIPYKRTVVPFLDELSAEASAIGAVNTIVIRDGKMSGYNSDIEGFATPLKPYAELIKGKPVAVFGNGGAALAAIEAFRLFFAPDEIIVYARNPEKANEMLEEYTHKEIVTLCPQNLIDDRFRNCAVVVNATPIGTKGRNNDQAESIVPLDHDLIHKRQIIYDMVYNPLDTPLLLEAKRQGATTISGIEMLIGQAAISFALWTGESMPVDAVKAVIMEEIKGKQTK
ncbi:MAG: shikimate dehydrogenase [Chlorobiaceae bacterium]|nr:shikimate dehydrogenase [Chlorobiaceae bacterium]